MDSQYNLRSPAVKRLMKEAEELRQASHEYYAQPLDDNLFEWHFTVRGPPDSDFDHGHYHGRIILPTEYPMKPPSIIMLTPNGRFEINKKICLSISGHHPESWQPSWSIRTALLAIIGFMPSEGLGAIGSLDYPSEERKNLAQKSQQWSCPTCGPISKLLKLQTDGGNSAVNNEAKALAKQISFKGSEIGSQVPVRASGANTTASSNEEPVEPTNTSKITEKESSNTSNSTSETIPTPPTQEQPRTQNSTIVVQNTNSTASSSTRISTYAIGFLAVAIAFLIFRRVFLMD